jgi:hypothetical protein
MMKLVREHINEKFDEGGDPISNMNIGQMNRILQDLKAANIPEGSVDIDDNFFIHSKTGRTWRSDKLLEIQLKYLSDEQRLFAESIMDLQHQTSGHPLAGQDYKKLFSDYVKEALDNKVKPNDIKKIVKEFGSELQNKQLTIVLTNLTRSKKQIKEDNENNTYVFIGYTEDYPVIVNGEKYYKKRLQAEKMVKIDKYNISDLQSIAAMKIRANSQYGDNPDAGVYFIYVPKYIMDEESYKGIPEENRYIIEKYKKRV